MSFASPTGLSPYLMFTNRHEIRRIDLLKSEYAQVVPTLKNAVALDVDVSTNKMFWCDLYHRKIYRYACTHTHTMYSSYDLFDIYNPDCKKSWDAASKIENTTKTQQLM